MVHYSNLRLPAFLAHYSCFLAPSSLVLAPGSTVLVLCLIAPVSWLHRAVALCLPLRPAAAGCPPSLSCSCPRPPTHRLSSWCSLTCRARWQRQLLQARLQAQAVCLPGTTPHVRTRSFLWRPGPAWWAGTGGSTPARCVGSASCSGPPGALIGGLGRVPAPGPGWSSPPSPFEIPWLPTMCCVL